MNPSAGCRMGPYPLLANVPLTPQTEGQNPPLQISAERSEMDKYVKFKSTLAGCGVMPQTNMQLYPNLQIGEWILSKICEVVGDDLVVVFVRLSFI